MYMIFCGIGQNIGCQTITAMLLLNVLRLGLLIFAAAVINVNLQHMYAIKL